MAAPAVESGPSSRKSRVVVPNFQGKKLVGILDDTGSPDLCILCHGLRSSKESTGLVVLANALAEAGLSTYRFDFSGNGESEGEFSYGGYWQEVEDLRAVVLHWRAQTRLVNCIIGHSKGGNAVLLYSSKYGDVPLVVNCSGRGLLKRGLKSRLGSDFMERLDREGFVTVRDKQGDFNVTKENLMQRLSIDMFGEVGKIPSNCRVLTIHGSEDEVVTVEDAYEFDKHVPNHTLRIVEGADHGYSSHLSELKQTVLEFVQGESCQGRALM
ncbi:hypothetical protein SELMODRAFT_447411 [Selaginella moellendorffii]|uniref:Serine aminopeptidase S33 domain-containing protein n=1 Tax=Selaginella moellendorffii TaxID=88036 RepID=D8SZ83_SELML|nr:hypothetical protein SELMODRAFT_447411 [Selaginella moellendorffii]